MQNKTMSLGEAREELVNRDFEKLLRAHLLFRNKAVDVGISPPYVRAEKVSAPEISALFKMWFQARGQFLIYAGNEQEVTNLIL